jgi:RND family efflux transporter MFP subunit
VAQVAASASGRGGAGRSALLLRSRIDGTLVTVSVTTGQTVEEGDPMFVVIDLTRVWLEARVFEPDIPKVETARTAWFTIDGYDEPFGVDEANGRLVTVGRLIDPATRTVPVIFELANPEGRLRIGQFAKVWIATGAPVRALAIPETAIIEEAGKAIAYVQVEGEAFERRALTVGVRSRGWVEVKEGLAAGERVVVKGAYEIKLASAAGSIPAHGHAH